MEEVKKDVLEYGTYEMTGPGKDGILIDELHLKGDQGQKRIWRIKEITPKQVIFEIIKF
jgi:hypothetical protein